MQHLKLRVADLRGSGLITTGATLHADFRIAVADVALDLDAVAQLVYPDAIGGQLAVPLGDRHLTVDCCIAGDGHAGVVAIDLYRLLAAVVATSWQGRLTTGQCKGLIGASLQFVQQGAIGRAGAGTGQTDGPQRGLRHSQ